MRRLPKPEGFTLIELLLVIVIIGLLAVMASSVFWRAKNRGFEAAMQSDLKTASVQQEHYFERNSRYASAPEDLPNFSLSPGVLLDITYADFDGWAGVVTHQSAVRRCGLYVGAAPDDSAPPATEAGIIMCGEP